MNIHDLMIGDWVNFLIDIEGGDTEYDPKNEIYQPMQVDSVSALDEVTSAFFGVTNDVAQLKPIPLTPEILEKNGFNRSSLIDNRWIYEDIVLSKLNDCYTLNYMIGKSSLIYYVHELQHALRLCNIEKEIEL